MSIRNLWCGVLFFSSIQAALATDSPKPVEQYNKTISQLNSNASDPAACATTAPVNASANAPSDEICTDLFKSACMDQGKSKYAGKAKALDEELAALVKGAQDKTAKQLGFKGMDDGYIKMLKESGIILSEPVNLKVLKSVCGSWDPDVQFEDIKKLFPSLVQCDSEIGALNKVNISTITDETKLKDELSKIKAVQDKYNALIVPLYAKNIPQFINRNLVSGCSDLKRSKQEAANPEMAQKCVKLSEIRQQAVQLFRKEGTKGYNEAAEKFVKENMLTGLKNEPVIPVPGELSEADKMRDQYVNKTSELSNFCNDYQEVMTSAAQKIYRNYSYYVNTSKNTVDEVIDTFYTASNKAKATELYKTTIDDVKKIATALVTDPSQKQMILSEYDKLNLFWMEKPPQSAYVKDGHGWSTLDENQYSYASQFLQNQDIVATFSDPSLSFFTALNANYMPSAQFGKMSAAERVKMMPAFIHMMEGNPYAFLSAMAHEVGHKIGPEVSKINGYNLTPEYKDLIACYKDSKSIHLISGQEDETIADYISSEVLALEISKLPADPATQRREALKLAMADFCIFDDDDSAGNFSSCKESHPNTQLRVAGIYGASPNLRTAIGCVGESPEYKSCGSKSLVKTEKKK